MNQDNEAVGQINLKADSGHEWFAFEDYSKALNDLKASRSRVKELEKHVAVINLDRERLDNEASRKDVWVKHHQQSVELALGKLSLAVEALGVWDCDTSLMTDEQANKAIEKCYSVYKKIK